MKIVKKIILEMTQKEFDSMIQMISDNAIMIGCADEKFTIPTIKNVSVFNKMLKRNNQNIKIKA